MFKFGGLFTFLEYLSLENSSIFKSLSLENPLELLVYIRERFTENSSLVY